MSATAFADHLDRYAASFAAPVEDDVAVESRRRRGDRFDVVTDARRVAGRPTS